MLLIDCCTLCQYYRLIYLEFRHIFSVIFSDFSVFVSDLTVCFVHDYTEVCLKSFVTHNFVVLYYTGVHFILQAVIELFSCYVLTDHYEGSVTDAEEDASVPKRAQ